MSIRLEPKLQNKLDQVAQRLGRSADEIADEAIRAHLAELDVDALEEEERAYRRLYPELREHHLHQVVAICGGSLIDVDADFETLFLRIQRQVGDRAVLVRRVDDAPVEEYRFRSPRLEQAP